MASFQVPQFLDSGDKILGPMNLRQFGYALGGFMISVLIFTLVNNAFPTAGLYGFIPAIPVAALAGYAALGKYNGRDADFYIIKFIIFALKPRFLKFSRLPDNSDLDARMGEYTESKIKARWASRLSDQEEADKDPYSDFRVANSELKADKIRNLGQLLDLTVENASLQVGQTEVKRQSLESQLQGLSGAAQTGQSVAQSGAQRRVGPQVQGVAPVPQVQRQNYFN
jgi:hypothetical protein